MVGDGQTGELLSSGYQGVTYKVAAGGAYPDCQFLIVKQAMGSPLVRRFRVWMIRRENQVYRRLDGIEGIPRCFGMQDGNGLLLEFIESSPLKLSSDELEDRDLFFARLLEVLQSVHRAGVAHADLKRKENILVANGERPYLIDFGSAITCSQNSGPFRRWLFRQACRIDLNAWIKHKYLGRYEEISDADVPFFRPTKLERIVRPLRRTWRKLTARRWRKTRRRRSHS